MNIGNLKCSHCESKKFTLHIGKFNCVFSIYCDICHRIIYTDKNEKIYRPNLDYSKFDFIEYERK